MRDATAQQEAIVNVIAKKQSRAGVVQAVVLEIEALGMVVAAHVHAGLEAQASLLTAIDYIAGVGIIHLGLMLDAGHAAAVGDGVAPRAGHHAQLDGLFHVAIHLIHVLAADAVEAQFISHTVLQHPVIEGFADLATLSDFAHREVGITVGKAVDHELFVLLGAAHFHDFSDHVGVLSSQDGQQVTPAFQLGYDFLAVQVVNLLRPLIAKSLLNDGIGEMLLHVRGLGHPLLPRHATQEGAVITQRCLVQAFVVGVVIAKILEVAHRKLAADDKGQHAIALKEGDIAVFRYSGVGAVAVLILHFGPAPLVLVPVPVANPHIEQARTGEGHFIDFIIIVL